MTVQILVGDVRQTLAALPEKSVNCCVTSPPYFGLRDYGVEGQIGLEPTPAEFVAELVAVFREVRRVLRDDGTLWLNLGDSYAGGGGGNYNKAPIHADHGQRITNVRNRPQWLDAVGLKSKDLIGIPWRVAFALQADGWYLRQDIIWHKPNPMPESVTDRCTKAHEYVFLLSKSARYHFDSKAMQEQAVGANMHDLTGPGYAAPGQAPNTGNRSKRDSFKREDSKRADVIPGQTVGTHRPDRAESEHSLFTRNKRSVWTVATRPYKGAHFATFPPDLIRPCVLAGAPFGGVVLDPFLGSGTTAAVAVSEGRHAIGCELNPEYVTLAQQRIAAAEAEVLW